MGRGWKRIALDADTAPVPYPTVVLQMDQAAPPHQTLSGHQRERREEPDLVRRRHLCADRYRQKGTETRCLALHLSTDSFGLDIRENRDFMRPSAISPQRRPTRLC